MSNAHKGSRLLRSGNIVPVDSNTTFLCHFDITESDVLHGIAPINNVTTLRPLEGKFGGGIAIEESTTNLIPSSDLSNLHGWNSTDGGNSYAVQQLDGFWRVPLKNNWTGNANVEILMDKNYSVTSGNTYTESFYYRSDGNTTFQITFFTNNGHHPVTPTMTPAWGNVYRASASYTVESGGTSIRALDINGFSAGTSTYFDFYQGQLEQKAFPTSYVNGSRGAGVLSYSANCINPNQGTISFWYYPEYPSSAVTSQSNSPKMVQVGNYYSNSSFTIWNINNSFNVYVKGATNSGWSLSQSNGSKFTQNQWSMITVTWSGTTWKTYLNGALINTGTASENLGPIAGNIFYVGGDGNGTGSTGQVCNGIIDELRIDNIARTDEEILSWYISQQPFFPKGIYTVAY